MSEAPETQASQRMRTALDLFELAVEMQRLNLSRRFPEADSARIDNLMQEWLQKKDVGIVPAAKTRGQSPA